MSNNKILKITKNILYFSGRMMLSLFSIGWVLNSIIGDTSIYYASSAQKIAILIYVIVIGSYVIWDIYKLEKSIYNLLRNKL